MRSLNTFASFETYRVQKTVKRPIRLRGIGLHSGFRSELSILPAPPNTGVVFIRTDIRGASPIRAHYGFVADTQLATSLASPHQPDNRVGTVEHILSALFGLGIQNARIEIGGPEIPILDGSAFPFVEAILDAEIEFQPFTAGVLRVLKPIKVYQGGAICELLPRDRLRLTTSIDFPHPSIGLQTFAVDLTPEAFVEQVSKARTFGFVDDLDKLRSKNLAQGASLENVLAFSKDGIENPEGMRYADECVRHKLLDAVGDLALCGSWIQGELVSFRGGHFIHFQLMKALQEQRSHWEFVSPEPLAALHPAFVAEGGTVPTELPAMPMEAAVPFFSDHL